jgi:hypothetical protein
MSWLWMRLEDAEGHRPATVATQFGSAMEVTPARMITGDCREVLRVLRNAVLVLLGLVILLAVAGATYQSVASRAEARRSPEAGRLVDVGGYRLKINCTGEGGPTVVLEAGLSDVSVEWKHVQPEIARFSRVCSYDRAGYGGSDAGPMPRTSAESW